ncbi:SCO family protein [Porticoccaceae bacterium]|nr:SCO family protein [Porticoccaceae bacterium]MDC0010259.1 SCO family protein [Porticoccaceae bacterium]
MKQQTGIKLTVLVILCFIVLVIFGFAWKMRQPVPMSAEDLRVNGAIELSTPRIFSDFDLIDHHGKPFTLENFKGVWSIVFFGFTNCPDICPTTLATLNAMYEDLGDSEKENLQIVMVSLDPERDTVEKMALYVPYFNEDFIGITGNPYSILGLSTQLTIAYTKVDLGEDNYTVDHSTQVVLINPKGHYHGFFKAPHGEVAMRQTWRSIKDTFAR